MNAMPLKFKVILTAVLFVLIFGGAWFYLVQEQTATRQAQAELIAAARLKIDEIVQWRSDMLADATVLTESPFFIEGVQRWLTNPSADEADLILTRFRSMVTHYQYANLTLLDANGKAQLGYPVTLMEPLPPEMKWAFNDAMQQRKPVLTDLYNDANHPQPHIEVIAPLYLNKGNGSKAIGAVVLQSNASHFIYPLIQTWPTTSQTAETLLIRKEGEDVLFLNDLRFQKNAALNLRIPMNRTDIAAVLAVSGQKGVVLSKDYRGVEILAYLAAIPDSPWFIVSKIDIQEALSTWRTFSSLILVFLLGVGIAAIAGVGMFWQREAAYHYRALLQAEIAQTESEARYATTLLSIGDGVITTDGSGLVEMMNPVAEMLTGWKQEEARGKLLSEVFKIVNEETRQDVENPVMCVLRDGKIVGLANHTLLISRSGREYPIADSGAPIRVGNEKPSGVVLVFRDQSEERAATFVLQAIANRQKDLLAAIPDIIMEVDNDKVYRWANQAGINFFGEDVIGIEADHYFIGEQKVYETVQPLFMGNEEIIYVESWQRRQDGEKRLLAWWCRVLKDPQGKVIGALSSARDITEHRQAEEALQHSEERLRALFENMAEAVALHQLVFNEGGQPINYRIMGINPKYESILGLNRQEVIGRLATDVYAIPQAPYLQEYSTAAMSGKTNHLETYYAPMNKYFDISIAPWGENGFATIFSDITDRKQTEKVLKAYSDQLEEMVEERTHELHQAQEKLIRQERLAVLGQLAGGVGHELRNPLGVMANAVYYLKFTMPNADQKVKQYFGILENEIHTAEKIISDLLDFSRVKSVDREKTAIVPFIERLLERHKPPKHVTVTLDIADDLPPFYADPRQISQVLGNLMINAYQAMPNDGELIISASSQDDKIILNVQDSGTGISAENINQIFEPLFTTKARGIGLGLAVSKRLVEVNDGEITVQSEINQGSLFTVKLPTFRGGS